VFDSNGNIKKAFNPRTVHGFEEKRFELSYNQNLSPATWECKHLERYWERGVYAQLRQYLGLTCDTSQRGEQVKYWETSSICSCSCDDLLTRCTLCIRW
jgi:hypothetical protein